MKRVKEMFESGGYGNRAAFGYKLDLIEEARQKLMHSSLIHDSANSFEPILEPILFMGYITAAISILMKAPIIETI